MLRRTGAEANKRASKDAEKIMSTSTRYGEAFGTYSDALRIPRFGKALSGLRNVWDGIGEGFAASRRYHQLTARGIPHEQAASKVFFEHYANR
jgi:hypothetical protein